MCTRDRRVRGGAQSALFGLPLPPQQALANCCFGSHHPRRVTPYAPPAPTTTSHTSAGPNLTDVDQQAPQLLQRGRSVPAGVPEVEWQARGPAAKRQRQ